SGPLWGSGGRGRRGSRGLARPASRRASPPARGRGRSRRFPRRGCRHSRPPPRPPALLRLEERQICPAGIAVAPQETTPAVFPEPDGGGGDAQDRAAAARPDEVDPQLAIPVRDVLERP